MKRYLIILLASLLAFSTAACGGGDDGGDNGGDQETANDTQTTEQNGEDADTEQADAPSNSSGEAGGMQTVTAPLADGGTLTFEIRSDWAAETSGDVIVIANSDAALTADNAALEAGQMRAEIEFILDGSARLEELGLRDTTPALQFMNTLAEVLDSDTIDYELDAPRGGMISGSVIAMSTGAVTIDGTTIDAKAFIIDKRVGYGQLIAYAPAEEAAQYEGALRNVMGSMEYEAAE